MTAGTQGPEHTLDDSKNSRVLVSQAFRSAECLIHLALNVSKGLIAYLRSTASLILKQKNQCNLQD